MTLNPQELYAIAHSNPTAESMFTAWAIRERHRDRLDIRKFRKYLADEGIQLNDEQFQDTLKKVAETGAAKIRHNLRGVPTYLEWQANVKEVGLLGIEGDKAKDKIEVSGLKKPKLRLVRRPPSKAAPVAEIPVRATQTILAIPLSNGKMFFLNMPDGLSDADLNNIAVAVKAAPIRKA